MRYLRILLIVATLLSTLGCRAIWNGILDGMFARSNGRTSNEPGISDTERQARWEEENIRENLDKINSNQSVSSPKPELENRLFRQSYPPRP